MVIDSLHALRDKKSSDVRYIVQEFKAIMTEIMKQGDIDDQKLWISYLLSLLPPEFYFVCSLVRDREYTKLEPLYRYLLEEFQASESPKIPEIHNLVQLSSDERIVENIQMVYPGESSNSVFRLLDQLIKLRDNHLKQDDPTKRAISNILFPIFKVKLCWLSVMFQQ